MNTAPIADEETIRDAVYGTLTAHTESSEAWSIRDLVNALTTAVMATTKAVPTREAVTAAVLTPERAMWMDPEDVEAIVSDVLGLLR